MAKKIDFITEKKEFNAAEFYKKHQKHLPKLMMVTQGLYGNGIEETFEKGEVLLLVIVSEQRRVMTRVQSNAGRCRLLSIPSSYHETLCIVSDDRRNVRESYLCDILREHRLPFTVQFPMDRVITVGDKSLNTNRIPKMDLFETFEEKHLLGNRIVDDEMTEDILHIPLYLSQMRMSIISGIKGQSKHQWKLFQQDLVHKSIDVEYDFEFGNPDIAEYKVDGDHSVKEYPFEEPQIYENIINIIQRWPECHPRHELGILRGNGVNTHKEYCEGILKTQEYETVEYKPPDEACGKQDCVSKFYKEDIQSSVKSDDIYTDLITNEERSRKEVFHTDTQGNVYESIGNAVVYEEIGSFERTVTDQHPLDSDNSEHIKKLNIRPGQSKAHPSTIKNASYVSCKEVEIDKRNSTYPCVTLIPDRTIPSVIKNPEEHEYVNNIPSTMVAPVVNLSQTLKISVDQTLNASQSFSRNESCTDLNMSNGQISLGKDAIAELTIQEVCEYLNKLHLEQYEQSFTEQMIDGAILAELDKDILVQEFGMKKVEALSLMKFAKEGRLPKST